MICRHKPAWPLEMLLLAALLAVAGCTPDNTRSDLAGSEELGGSGRQMTGEGAIYVKMAIGYMRAGKIDIALQQVRKALRVEPGNADAHGVLALIYERLGENALAERYFNKGLSLNPRDSFIHNAYGAYLCKQKRYQEADEQFALALRNPLYPTPEVALTNAGLCRQKQGDIAAAAGYLRSALQRNPRFPVALLQMAMISLDQANYLSARAYLQRYQEVARHTAESLWVGIQVERQLGDQDALASYKLSLKNNFPDSREAQRLRESDFR